MCSTDFLDIKVGDTFVLPIKRRRKIHWSLPTLTRRLVVVQSMDESFFYCKDQSLQDAQWCVRRFNGKLIGDANVRVQIATPELISQINHEYAVVARDRAARHVLADLSGLPGVVDRLSLEQLEALANAWQDIKAMAPAFAARQGDPS